MARATRRLGGGRRRIAGLRRWRRPVGSARRRAGIGLAGHGGSARACGRWAARRLGFGLGRRRLGRRRGRSAGARVARCGQLGDPVDGLAGSLLGLGRTLLGLRDPIEHLLQAPLALRLLGLQLREPLGPRRSRLGLAGPRLGLLEPLGGALERLRRALLLVVSRASVCWSSSASSSSCAAVVLGLARSARARRASASPSPRRSRLGRLPALRASSALRCLLGLGPLDTFLGLTLPSSASRIRRSASARDPLLLARRGALARPLAPRGPRPARPHRGPRARSAARLATRLVSARPRLRLVG